MSNENELDEILASIKKHKEQVEGFSPEDFGIEPPKASREEQFSLIEQERLTDNNILQTDKAEERVPKEKKNTKKEKKPKKPKSAKKESTGKKAKKSEKNKKSSGYGMNMKIVAFVAVVTALSIGICLPASLGKGYIRRYENKYGIDFPENIAEEFCDAYAENQTLVGRLDICDINYSINVLSEQSVDFAYTDYGTDILSTQQFQSIHIDKAYANLEKLYSSYKDFQNSSQKIVFRDLTGRERTFQVFACYYVATNPSDDKSILGKGYRFPYNLYGDLVENDFDYFKDSINHRALYNTGYNMSYFGKYLTVSINSSEISRFRFVIICAECEGKIKPVKSVKKNDNIQYPQIWYDINNLPHKYQFSIGWQPKIYTDEDHTQTAPLEIK